MSGVGIVEVGPRDGLQNESGVVSTETKLAFVQALADAGHRRIEVTAFVSPRRIPQLADAEDVMKGLPPRSGVTYSALVPNLRGWERARSAGVGEVAVFTAATETFNRRNINASVEESLERFRPVLEAAGEAEVPVRGYVSTVFHCPYEGPVSLEKGAALCRRLLQMGCREVSLGDTIGKATPAEVRELCRRLRDGGLLEHSAMHFHDTYGMACANALAAYEEGVRVFDASSGGLGGCPYAPGATGNVATEDLVHLFRGLGVDTGLDLQALVKAARMVEEALGRALPGRVYRALTAAGTGA